MSTKLTSIWQTHVQKRVDDNYVHSNSAREGLRVRADVRWKWGRIFTMAKIWDSYAPLSASSESIALCLVVEVGDAEEFPIGMLTVVPGFFCSAFCQERLRSFTWYLADAPREVYTELLSRAPVKGVAQALIDCSIQAGLEIGGDGTLLLRADPQGGPRLRHFYQNDCAMTPLPEGHQRISRLRLAPSDEYFHFDAAQANAYCAQFDHRR